MSDPTERYKNLEKHMLAMRRFFTEYFRRTISGVIDEKSDLSFLELKGIAAFIDGTREYTMTEISNIVHLPLSNITSIINRLARRKIVKKQRDGKDKRIVRVSLTERGRKMRYDFMEKRGQEVKNFLGKLSEQDQNELLNALETATKIFQKI